MSVHPNEGGRHGRGKGAKEATAGMDRAYHLASAVHRDVLSDWTCRSDVVRRGLLLHPCFGGADLACQFHATAAARDMTADVSLTRPTSQLRGVGLSLF